VANIYLLNKICEVFLYLLSLLIDSVSQKRNHDPRILWHWQCHQLDREVSPRNSLWAAAGYAVIKNYMPDGDRLCKM
jgi:hypothetical protein